MSVWKAALNFSTEILLLCTGLPRGIFNRTRVCIFFGAFVIFMCILLHV